MTKNNVVAYTCIHAYKTDGQVDKVATVVLIRVGIEILKKLQLRNTFEALAAAAVAGDPALLTGLCVRSIRHVRSAYKISCAKPQHTNIMSAHTLHIAKSFEMCIVILRPCCQIMATPRTIDMPIRQHTHAHKYIQRQ